MIRFQIPGEATRIANSKQSSRRNSRKHAWRAACEPLEARRLLTVYVVETIADDTGDGLIGLREAITAANNNSAFGDAPAGQAGPGVTDSITFAPLLSGETIALGGTELTISDDLNISEGNASLVTISAGGQSRALNIVDGAGAVSISDLTITGGSAGQGGGVFMASGQSLSLTAVTLTGNTASGAALTDGGGGIYNAGDLTISGGSITANTAAAGGGVYNAGGSVTVSNVSIASNTATGNAAAQGGGGLYNAGGSVDIDGGSITENLANGASGSGGGIFNNAGVLNVSSTSISGNTATRAGGGIEDNALAGGTMVALAGVTLSGNSTGNSPGNGGGLHMTGPGSVSLTGGLVTANTAAAEGGGLWNSSNGVLTVTEVTVQGNTASGNAADQGGGGIFSDGGTTMIIRSTISNNMANGTNGNGGGVHVAGGTTTISNSTVSTNQAAGGSGGGVAVAGGTVNLIHATIAANTAAVSGGGVANLGGTANAQNTIVAQNTAAAGPDASGTITSGDFNLIGSTAGANVVGQLGNSIVNVNAMLGALSSNGGPTRTHLPLAMSPAINAGSNAGLAIDQRGVTRPQDGLFDIGAVEVQPGDQPAVTLDANGNLIVNGSGRIIVYGEGGAIRVRINNVVSGPMNVTGRVIITGGDGRDTIILAGRLDIGADIFAAGGNDYVASNLGDDSLFGGGGNDVLYGGEGDNYLEGNAGNDRLETRAGVDTIIGGEGNDRLQSQGGDDFLNGGLGNDLISGGDGDDFVRGGDGNDVMTGYLGNDILLGEGGADQLFGRQGNDLAIGGAGSDRISTDMESDILVGNASNLDDNDQALRSVLAELAAGNGFENILNGTGGVPQLIAVEDNAADDLIGEEDSDLYFVSLSDMIRNPTDDDVIVS